MKLYSTIAILFICLVMVNTLIAQTRVGINTDDPLRTLEVRGANEQKVSVLSTPGVSGGSGLELITGDNVIIDTDWKILNESGGLKFYAADYNMNFFSEEVMRINAFGNIGLGTNVPATRLHIDGGSTATLGGGGYMTLGSTTSYNVVYDNTQIMARNNGLIAPLYIQPYGGNTYVGSNGGNVGIASAAAGNGTRAGIGTESPSHRVSIKHTLYHLYLRNAGDNDANDWYIGASGASWGVGPDQLIFAPNSSSAVFRLMDVTDNNGDVAPVIIHSSESQILLMDGNEIDTKAAPLYFNYNSENDVILNAQDGNVGIGTNNPQGKLHVRTDVGYDLALEYGTAKWQISAYTDANVYFWNNGLLRAYIHWNGGGSWVQVSDRRLKENITKLKGAMDIVRNIRVKRYTYRHDPEATEDIGVIAQEVREVLPEAVFEEEDRYGVNYDQITTVALQGVKEQQERLDGLVSKVDRL